MCCQNRSSKILNFVFVNNFSRQMLFSSYICLQAHREGSKNSRSPSVQRSESSSDISGRSQPGYLAGAGAVTLARLQLKFQPHYSRKLYGTYITSFGIFSRVKNILASQLNSQVLPVPVPYQLFQTYFNNSKNLHKNYRYVLRSQSRLQEKNSRSRSRFEAPAAQMKNKNSEHYRYSLPSFQY